MIKQEFLPYKNSWRSNYANLVEPVDGLNSVFEFGVFSGNSMIEYSRMLNHLDLDLIVGFDSFDGIPMETAEPVQDLWNPNKSHFHAAFNASKAMNVTPEEAEAAVIDYVKSHKVGDVGIRMVRGFYCDSLTESLAKDFDKALVVDIDSDIYTSAKDALSWLFKFNLVGSGTVFFYDDWGGTPGHKEMKDGESRAHREVTEEYDLQWEKLGATSGDGQVVWRLL